MNEINEATSVGELVRVVPARSRVFEARGIDYCCGGRRPLGEVCREKGLPVQEVLAELAAVGRAGSEGAENPDALGLAALCDRIVGVHHGYLRSELPRLDFLTHKVSTRHGEHEPRLLAIRGIFEAFHHEMVSHALEEETLVFPRIRALEGVGAAKPASSRELCTLLDKLECEHSAAGRALEEFRSLTDGYTPPDWACNTFRALYDALAQLEKSMHQHVHEENNILFPKALAHAE